MRHNLMYLICAVLAPASLAGVPGLDGTVDVSLVTGNIGGTPSEFEILDAIEVGANVELVDGLGKAIFSGNAGASVSGGSITVEVSQIGVSSRRVTVCIDSSEPAPGFLNASSSVNGSAVDFIGVRFGDDSTFAGTLFPQDTFDDPSVLEVTSATLDFEDVFGNPGFSFTTDSVRASRLVFIVGGTAEEPVLIDGVVWEQQITRGTLVIDYTFNLCRADFNNDTVVDIIDFGIFGTAFGSSTSDLNYDERADFNDDGVIDIIDFGVFGTEFNSGPEVCAP